MGYDIGYQRRYNGRAERTVVCVACGREFKTYYKHKKTCSDECQKERRRMDAKSQHRADPERAKRIRRRHWQEHRAEEQRRRQEWFAENPGKIAEYQARDAPNRPRRWKAWAEKNRDKLREKKHRRRARKLSASTGELTTGEMVRRRDMFGECIYCGRGDDGLTVDHLVPLAKGGRHESENLVGGCMNCNRSKGAKPWREWFRSRPFYSPAREYMITLLTGVGG